MKKVLLGMTALMFVVAAQADLVSRTWNGTAPLYTAPSFSTPAVEGEGAGWQIDVALAGSDGLIASFAPAVGTIDAGYGWYGAGGGYYITDILSFDALEGESVVARIWAEDAGAPNVPGSWYLDSVAVALPDLVDPIGPTDADFAFDFAGSEWTQVVPEPATIGLMGIAGLGMFLARKKVRA